MSRTRTRTVPCYGVGFDGQSTYYGDYLYDFFYEDRYPGSCQCEHTVFQPYSGPWYTTSQGTTYLQGFSPYYVDRELLRRNSNVIPFQLNRNKLPSSTQFGLIQFFAELDDTLALFGARFWRNLTYGSITWGLLPFLADLKNILSALANFDNAFANGGAYEDALPYTIENINVYVPGAGGYCDIRGTGLARLTGRYVLPEQIEAQRLLDYLGFHPDIQTAWDLVPLSFVVDWFLPVGDLLDKVHTRGWIRSVQFTGWATLKCSGKISWTKAYDGNSFSGAASSYKTFTRGFWDAGLHLDNVNEPMKTFALQLPSFKEMFNTLYILYLGRKFKV